MRMKVQEAGKALLFTMVAALFSSPLVHSEESLTVVTLAAGGAHTCAVISDGTVRCWGDNSKGGLGIGKITQAFEKSVQVADIHAARQIAAGLDFTCASLVDGTVRCWGNNQYGQRGDGTTNNTLLPVAVTGLHSATDVAAGFHHACALLKDGSVSCWGRNEHGQLGNATQIDASIPVPVSGITTATAVITGDYHSCALLQAGTVRCWGGNDLGQLGNGTKTDAAVPVGVTGLKSVTAIGAGNGFNCAVLSTGRIKCWGGNRIGQLGNGTRKESPVPVDTTGITSAQKVVGGSFHACALLREGTVKCWGFNNSGQLGNGERDYVERAIHEQNILTSVEVIDLKSARDVTTGLAHSCAIEGVKTVKCWGLNNGGGYYAAEARFSTSTPVVVPVIQEE
jgi:alpha-tubulin suppressor-like RCC1 family protein